jgi:twitching motility protein PilI
MSVTVPEGPLAILEDYERRARQSALGIPKIEQVREMWLGIGFRMGDTRLVMPAGEVSELLNYPRVQKVPGTREWVMGLANVRGRILTLIDLAGFLTGVPTALHPRSRAMIVKDEAMQVGFLVEEVSGLKHFFGQDYEPATDGFGDWIRPFLKGRFVDHDLAWGVVNLPSVVNSPEFMQVGA